MQRHRLLSRTHKEINPTTHHLATSHHPTTLPATKRLKENKNHGFTESSQIIFASAHTEATTTITITYVTSVFRYYPTHPPSLLL